MEMKILLLDTETTGVNRDKDNVLEFGAMLYNPEEVHSFKDLNNSPKITITITRPNIRGSYYALNMNSEIIKETLRLCEAHNISNEYKEYGVQVPVRQLIRHATRWEGNSRRSGNN